MSLSLAGSRSGTLHRRAMIGYALRASHGTAAMVALLIDELTSRHVCRAGSAVVRDAESDAAMPAALARRLAQTDRP